ncbi:MAG: NAD(P)H-dependent oxidoreductase [Minisyncoccia bacterium]|jgi:nitroreductase
MGFIENLNWRYATKKFDGRKLPPDIVEKILAAIQMAPSSFGLQPFHVTVIEDKKLRESLKPHAWGQEKIVSCSHLLVFSADSKTTKRTEDYLKLAAEAGRTDITEDPEYDYLKEVKKYIEGIGPEWPAKQAYIALGFAMAACADLKIDSCPIEGFKPAAFKEILKLPSNLDPKALLAIGYRSSDDTHVKLTKLRFSKKDLFDFR